MKSCRRLIFLFIKQQLAEKVFLLSSALFLTLFSAFALLCPENQPLSAEIGISFEKSESELDSAFSPLFDSTDIRFVYYSPDEIDMMKRDILLGKLHCGYLVSGVSEIPITVFESEGSILTPAADEIVFTSWFTSRIGDIAPDLYGGRHSELIAEAVERQRQSAKPFSLDISFSEQPLQEEGYSAVSPLIYAVSVSMSICCAAFCSILTRGSSSQALSLLCADFGRKRILLCRAAAQAMLYFSLLLCCEVILALSSAALPFGITARLVAAAVSAICCAAVGLTFSVSAPRSAPVCVMMLWSVGSVVFSGALISPELLGSLQWLRFLSPAWFVLKIMAALS